MKDAAATSAPLATAGPAALPAPHGPDEVTTLVRTWLERSTAYPVKGSARLLAGLLAEEGGLAFLTQFVDSVVRPEDKRVAARALRHLASEATPFLPGYQRVLLRIGSVASVPLPRMVVWAARRTVRTMVSHLIVDARPARLGRSLRRLRETGRRLNVNLLGEAVLGSAEADRRLDRTIALIRRSDVDYVSLKVSAAIAPHNPWGYEANVEHIAERLLPLFAAANESGPTFVNLDMEEYRDLDLTIDVFMRVLDRPEFLGLTAGIVLQAYLPDAEAALERLETWASARVAREGAPIKIRLVKGANLSMERVDAALHGWPLATWSSKVESDAHYKRLVDAALRPERVTAVRVGVAGHNLFDIAHALLLARSRGVADAVEFEMLLGMGERVASAVAHDTGALRLYTPVVHPGEFDVALAYLVRRLEEVASKDNFMSAVYRIAADQELFDREHERFLAAWRAVESPHASSHRATAIQPAGQPGFANAPDSDPSVAATRALASVALAGAAGATAGATTLAASRQTDEAGLKAVIAAAHTAAPSWNELTPSQRAAVLDRVADALDSRRWELIAVMAAEAHKTVDQADPEVSEAIDFARYYAGRARDLEAMPGAVAVPRRVTLVAPPWNFPVAIPAGSTLAALAAGSAVILKPAEQSPRCGALLAEIMWEAGVPRDALTLIHIDPETLGAALIGDERIDQVILTGAFETAQRMLEVRPEVRLIAETSGKNAIIVTPSADMDLAVRDVVSSAFGHQGQKCSAASLVILVGSVARSRRFMTQLADAVASLAAGDATDATTQVAPLIGPAQGKLLRALSTCEPGESWLVEPRRLDDEGAHWTPGVKLGVAPGSFFHLTECFGPVLGVMTASNLGDAIALANAVDYGLTAGLHSLDPDEVATWLAHIQAGNLYVNRGTTGAIVQRQPFGGWKRSVVGATAKAGGPSYLQWLCNWEAAELGEGQPTAEPSARVARLLDEGDAPAWVRQAAAADEAAWRERFGRGRDRTGLHCEANVLRYLPAIIDLRWEADTPLEDLVRVLAAARRAGATGVLSTEQRIPISLGKEILADGIEVRTESWDACVARVVRRGGGRIRLLAKERRVAGPAVAVFDAPVTSNPDLEMLPFLREQAVSITTHRFGTRFEPIAALAEELMAG